MRSALVVILLSVLTWTVSACDDDPFDVTWVANPDTALLYSLARDDLNVPSAFDFVPGRRVPVVVEAPGATGNWDLAVDTRDGEIVVLPPGALDIESRAGVATFPGLTLDEVEEAPDDSASYAIDEPVPVETGSVYVVRTRQARGRFSQVCVFFGKLEPVEVDAEGGTLRFVFDVNPDCNDRSLVPDEQPS